MDDTHGSNIAVYPREKHESHGDYAYRTIRQNILHFHMKPGELINENELSALLQVSRTPVHEAIIKLRSERLVDVVPRKESKVSRIEIALVNDGVFLRSCIESRILQSIQGNLSPADIKALLNNLELQRATIEAQNLYDFNTVDDEFHRLLFDIAGKQHIFENLKLMSTHLDRIRSLVCIESGSDTIRANYAEHMQLFEYIAFNVPLDAEPEPFITAHVTRFQRRMNAFIQTYPAYFSFN